MRSKVKKSDLDTFLQACNKDKFELSVDRYLYLYFKMSIPKDERKRALRQIQSVGKGICGYVSNQSYSKIQERAKDHIMECLETIQ